jgi:hypothetical protein
MLVIFTLYLQRKHNKEDTQVIHIHVGLRMLQCQTLTYWLGTGAGIVSGNKSALQTKCLHSSHRPSLSNILLFFCYTPLNIQIGII